MSDAPSTPSATDEAPAGYRLGDPIALHDLLALPPDGRRYTRDAEGRLALMSPDDARQHRRPLGWLTRLIGRALDDSWEVLSEPGIAFAPIFSLRGEELPASRLGRKTLEPDVAVFSGQAGLLEHRPGGAEVFSPDRLRLVVEVLSGRTRREDLGLGRADRVDRWRTYLANGVPEYWVLNAGLEGAALPARSALLLSNAGATWQLLSTPGLRHGSDGAQIQGQVPVLGGVVRSAAIPGLTFDLDAYWDDVARA